MVKILWHISFEPIQKFKLRVPKQRMEKEDGITSRICLCDSVKECFNAMPSGGLALQGLLRTKAITDKIVYAYSLHADLPDTRIIEPHELASDYGVKDALDTGEHWALLKPKFTEQILRIEWANFRTATDPNGNKGLLVTELEYDIEKEHPGEPYHKLFYEAAKQVELNNAIDYRRALAVMGEYTE